MSNRQVSNRKDALRDRLNDGRQRAAAKLEYLQDLPEKTFPELDSAVMAANRMVMTKADVRHTGLLTPDRTPAAVGPHSEKLLEL